MSEAHFTITIFITLLLIASGVAMLTKWIRVPYTLALVVVGLAISPMRFLPPVHISPDLILLIFLPALLFEAAWNLKLNELRANLVPILLLATVGVCLYDGSRSARNTTVLCRENRGEQMLWRGSRLHLGSFIFWPAAAG